MTPCNGSGREIRLGWVKMSGELGEGENRESGRAEVDKVLNGGYIKIIDRV